MPREIAYRTLASRLRTAVQEGEYDDGRPLPTEEQLSATYSLSRQTVRRAMQDLVAENIVYRVPGRGTFAVIERDAYVRPLGSIEELIALSEDTTVELIVPIEHRVDVESASRLRLSSDSVMTVSIRRFNRETPFCFTTVTLPPRIGMLVEDAPELTVPGTRSHTTVIGLIDSKLPLSIADAEQSVNATPCPEIAALHIDCKVGEPVLRIDRLYLDGAGVPVQLAVSYFDPRHYSYRVTLHRRPG